MAVFVMVEFPIWAIRGPEHLYQTTQPAISRPPSALWEQGAKTLDERDESIRINQWRGPQGPSLVLYHPQEAA